MALNTITMPPNANPPVMQMNIVGMSEIKWVGFERYDADFHSRPGYVIHRRKGLRLPTGALYAAIDKARNDLLMAFWQEGENGT